MTGPELGNLQVLKDADTFRKFYCQNRTIKLSNFFLKKNERPPVFLCENEFSFTVEYFFPLNLNQLNKIRRVS